MVVRLSQVFNDVKHALAHVVPLWHTREDMTVCVFTDASDLFWGAVATEVPPANLDLPLEDQRHQPLAFISGSFSGASARWPIVEKEAYAVVESCKRLDYLVVRPGGFRLFTDHRNLVYIFNPSGSNANMAKYQADKLQRWSLVMSTFPYTIECVSGDANVWGDLLSRWCSAPKPNELIHFDWLSMPMAKSGQKQVLVVKNDMSGFVQLFAAESADAAATAQCLMTWFTTFGCVDTWVSDGGSHFKNEVIEKVRKLVGAHHHITSAYSPWANGTVEVVNRLVLRAVKALLSEMKLNADEWPHVLPLVQAALNHQPADRLGGIAPVTAFTGLPAKTPLSGFYTSRTLGAACQKHVTDLQLALEEMHRNVAVRSDKLRQQARGRRDRKSQVKFAGFSVGDFVLVGSVVNRPTKLALHWRGPCQVTRVITDHVMETQQLVPPYEVTVHHACRLKMYHEGGREVTEDLEAQIAFGDGGFHVQRLDEARCVDGQHQVLVKWLGLDDEESSWEPAANLLDDIPVVFRKWAAANKEDPAVAALIKTLDFS
ncbi:hypothetical protein H257_13409 [Aphanomyces astaci]|uniref:Integrase catalytic domain-containing protein n=1 Tax=Aphanomyces astaci TaxID=112090 RepID=W4FWF5_APHAT|nr:hypothetical protein H257_13409 [Aphanomyces astaci]ETV71271.1 hypothetical protein H257_13409 [Aphanomyces astaci]|eukprot:XP_009839211.1 hypothetical protein H257_13409 [Aphanomyces astaci]